MLPFNHIILYWNCATYIFCGWGKCLHFPVSFEVCDSVIVDCHAFLFKWSLIKSVLHIIFVGAVLISWPDTAYKFYKAFLLMVLAIIESAWIK